MSGSTEWCWLCDLHDCPTPVDCDVDNKQGLQDDLFAAAAWKDTQRNVAAAISALRNPPNDKRKPAGIKPGQQHHTQLRRSNMGRGTNEAIPRVVRDNETGSVRMVEARTAAEALKYVVGDRFEVSKPTAGEVARLVASGIVLESVSQGGAAVEQDTSGEVAEANARAAQKAAA